MHGSAEVIGQHYSIGRSECSLLVYFCPVLEEKAAHGRRGTQDNLFRNVASYRVTAAAGTSREERRSLRRVLSQ